MSAPPPVWKGKVTARKNLVIDLKIVWEVMSFFF